MMADNDDGNDNDGMEREVSAMGQNSNQNKESLYYRVFKNK
jgi:hypothetical protein